MIELKEQNELFELIASKLSFDVSCYAFGGTAMMYYGYKNSTKDIDLLFFDKKSRDEFMRVLQILGYKEKPISVAYENKEKSPDKPVLLTRGEERFDIFIDTIFGINLKEEIISKFYGKYDFFKNKSLTIYAMKKEDIILLKSATNRIRDFDDILQILQKDEVDWDYITDAAVKLDKKGNSWFILDLEEKMRLLKKHVRIENKYFDKLYKNK